MIRWSAVAALALGAFVACSKAPSRADSPEDAGRMLFEALRAEDFRVVTPVLDVRGMCEARAEPRRRDKCLRKLERGRAEDEARFRRILEAGRKAGIRWSDIRLERIETSSPQPVRTGKGDLGGFETVGELRLHFSSDGRPLYLGLESMYRFDYGWASLDPFDHRSEALYDSP